MPLWKRNLLLLIVAAIVVFWAWWVWASHRKPAQPIVDRPRLASGVEMRDVTFYSQSLQRNVQYRVLMPRNAKQKLPVVYLLHGGGGTFRDWSNYSNVSQFAVIGLLLVMPEGDYSYYTNAALRPHDRYEDYIIHDLPADVESRFPARGDRNSKAIVGVSMGGFGAVNLALHHPDKFAFVGALSAAIDVPRRPFTWRRLDQSRRFREMFGPDGSESRRNNDPFVLVRSADPGTAPYFYLSCGKQEGLLEPNREFVALLSRLNVTHEFHIVPGGHDWNQWNAQLRGLFDSLTRHLEVLPGLPR
jgi:S-formylglutathione hydrolase FrmB